jgi:hypothetical protein
MHTALYTCTISPRRRKVGPPRCREPRQGGRHMLQVGAGDIRDMWKYTWRVEIYVTRRDIQSMWRYMWHVTCGAIHDVWRYKRHAEIYKTWRVEIYRVYFFNWSPPKLSKYKSLYNLWHSELQGGIFNWTPPKFSKYKIPLWLLTLREIPGQFAWDPLIRKFRGGPVKKTTL